MEPLAMEELELAPERPSLLFEEGSYSLPELLESHLLPVVVQYDVDRQPLPFNEFNFDLSQPLLLYKKRNIQKVSAKSLHISNGRYEEVGESLLIPEDYKGWFSVLARTTDLSVVNVDKVPHFSTVEELANSNSERFLIGGTKRLTGLQIDDRSSGQLAHTEIHISPGEVLTREKIYFGETKKKTRLFRKPKYIIEKFLMCRDEMEREILLPFEQQGIYYQISHKGGKAYNNVLQMSDVVARKMTPRLIKLVYGRFPVTPCSFTGLMKAESSDIETSVIACTLVNTKNVLLEIPVTSAMYFRIALTNDSLRLNTCYRNAISLCAERANTYMRNIKVCVNFPADIDQGPEDFISKRNRSNSFDIDAIQNNPRRVKENSIKKAYGSLKRPTGYTPLDSNMKRTRDMRLSESLSGEVSLRPGRCLSTGHMSFCLGNSYLTVPLFDSNSQQKRDSGNNNSIHQSAYTTKAGSRILFNGSFFEEEVNTEQENKERYDNEPELAGKAVDEELPPSLPCTNISSYVNLIEPPTGSPGQDVHGYISVSTNRTPSSNAPESAPPPLPFSYNVDGVSSGSLSSVNEEPTSKKGSRDSFEYAVPKRGEPSKLSKNPDVLNLDVVEPKERQPMARRPSTFTFTEGCLQSIKSKRSPCLQSPDEADSDFEEDCPVYENIKTLMEAVDEKEEIIKNTTEASDLHNVTQLTEKRCHENEHNSSHQNDDADSKHKNDDTDSKHKNDDADSKHQNDDADNKHKNDDADSKHKNDDADSKHKNDDADIKHSEENSIALELDTKLPVYHKIDASEESKQGIGDDKAESSEVGPDVTNDDNHTGDDSHDCATGKRERKIGVVNTGESYRTGVLTENAMETIVEADNNLINEHEHVLPKVEVESSIAKIAPDINQRNGTMWLSGLKKTTELESRIPNPQCPFYEEDIRQMSSCKIVEQLKLVGIKESTLKTVAELGVDGRILCDVLKGDTPISDCLVGVNLVDQQKISMFIRGWRPDMDYMPN